MPIVYYSAKDLKLVILELKRFIQKPFEVSDYQECDCPDCKGKSTNDIIEEKKGLRNEMILAAKTEALERLFVLLFYLSITILSIKHYLIN